jgi:hypothetical protein
MPRGGEAAAEQIACHSERQSLSNCANAAIAAVVGVAAAVVPAGRAVRMDPLIALRHE